MNKLIKWAAEIEHVREVSLLGTADLDSWKERLRGEGLAPAERDGRARVLVIAAELRFMGVRFREVSFSVLVAPPGGGDAAYLLRAFNSCRFFAWCERVFFATPYYPGDVRVSATGPVSIRLVRKDEVAFSAAMGGGRGPTRTGDDGWDGPVFLPAKRGGRGERLFFARLRGFTRAYPFIAGADTVAIRPAAGAEVLQTLLDSDFTPTEWIIRGDATHVKSKTYSRAEVVQT